MYACCDPTSQPQLRFLLLPMLPPLFVLLAWQWARRPPGRTTRLLFAVFAAAGLAPTAVALASGRPAMPAAVAIGSSQRTRRSRVVTRRRP